MDFKLSCVILALPILATMASAQTTTAPCKNEDVCTGVMSYCKPCPLGNGTMIDISAILTKSLHHKTEGLQPSENIFFSPCKPFTKGSCINTAVCLEKTVATVPAGHYTLGLPSEAKFSKCGEDFVLRYVHQDGQRKMTTEVTLICDEQNESFTVSSEHEEGLWPLPGDVKLVLRSKHVCPRAIPSTTHSTPSTTVTPIHHNTTATLPHHNTTATLPHHNTTATLPHHNTTATLPHHNTTATLPHHNTTATLPHHNTTATLPHHNTTATLPHSNTTVTLPHSNTTVTLPHSNTTVTLPHSNTTVTGPPSTTPLNSAVRTSSISATVILGITLIVQNIL